MPKQVAHAGAISKKPNPRKLTPKKHTPKKHTPKKHTPKKKTPKKHSPKKHISKKRTSKKSKPGGSSKKAAAEREKSCNKGGTIETLETGVNKIDVTSAGDEGGVATCEVHCDSPEE